MSNQKWEVGPVKLVGGYDAYLDFFCEARQVWIGRYKNVEGKWYGADWTIEGRHENLAPTMHLAPPPKKTVRVERWILVYANGTTITYTSHPSTRAMKEAKEQAFGLFKLDREVEEGEGLS